MTDQQLATWINRNMSPVINAAIGTTHITNYPVDLIGAMVQREVGFLMARYLGHNPNMTVADLSKFMRGDYGQRPGETDKQYHGFGFWQIDIASYPGFIKSGDWQDPAKCCVMAIGVLVAKRQYLSEKLPGLSGDDFERANVAAYNCGQGNVMKALVNHLDVDHYTYNHDYSKAVWHYRDLFRAAG